MGVKKFKKRHLEEGYLPSSSFPTRPVTFTNTNSNYSTNITYSNKKTKRDMQITIIVPASIVYSQEGESSVPPDSLDRVF